MDPARTCRGDVIGGAVAMEGIKEDACSSQTFSNYRSKLAPLTHVMATTPQPGARKNVFVGVLLIMVCFDLI